MSRREETLISQVPEWFILDSAHNSRTHVSAPIEVACYSRSADHVVHYGSRDGLRAFTRPVLPADLNKGFDSFIPKHSSRSSQVDPVVIALMKRGFDLVTQADVVTFRNNLNKIAATPYQRLDDWEMDAVQIGTTVFLDIRKKEEKSFPNQELYTYYGYSFEALCTSSDGPVDANQEFCSIVRLRIGPHRILMSAEVDAIMPDRKGGGEVAPQVLKGNVVQQYVEFKTTREPRRPRDFENLHKFKFLKFWIQSYLLGCPRILLGVRNDKGILMKIDELQVRQLPKLTRAALQLPDNHSRNVMGQISPQQRQWMNDKRAGIWDPFVCINHIDFLLDRIRAACSLQKGVALTFKYDSQTRSVTYFRGDTKAAAFASRITEILSMQSS